MTTANAGSIGLISGRNELINARVRVLSLVFGGTLCVLVMMALDHRLAHEFREYGVAAWIDDWDVSVVGWYVGRIMRQPGEWWAPVLCGVLLTIFHKQTWRAGGFVLLAFLPGAINGLLKWVAGRQRPFTGQEPWDWEFFRGGLAGLFEQRNLCFASGHATLAFAWAAAMAIALPRYRVVFHVIAVICGLQRVVSNDHYLTDVVAGAVLGIVTVKVLFRILSRIVAPAREGPAEGMGRTRGPSTGDNAGAADTGNGIHDSRPQLALPLAGHSLLQRAGERPHAAHAS